MLDLNPIELLTAVNKALLSAHNEGKRIHYFSLILQPGEGERTNYVLHPVFAGGEEAKDGQ